MSLQETAQITVRLTVSTDEGELPTPGKFNRLLAIRLHNPLGAYVTVIATEVLGEWSGDLV